MLAVYPRLRGGSAGTSPQISARLGLSPPTRGIRVGCDVNHRYPGSIPAYAGDPPLRAGISRGLRVYPRLRGGSPAVLYRIDLLSGLSPPTRGIPHRPPPQEPQSRSIPAYAGDPGLAALPRGFRAVYPRLRGGSRIIGQVVGSVPGLSPPTRGIPCPPHAAPG